MGTVSTTARLREGRTAAGARRALAPRHRSVDADDGQHDRDAARFPDVPGDAELVFRTTPDGRYTYVSPNVQAILGYKRYDLLAHEPLETVHPDDVSRLVTAGDRLFAGSPREIVRIRKRHADGHYVWLEAQLRAIRDSDGNEVRGIHATARDVTAQVTTERALHQRVGAETLIGEVARELLTAQADEVDAIVVRSLERAARFLSAERATLVVASQDGQWALRTHQWVSDPEFETDAEFSLAAMPWLVEQCRSGELVFARSLDELPPEASAERAAFENAGVRSFACLPITTGRQLTGGLAFNWRTREANECAPALSSLHVLGDVLVVALDRKRAEEARATSEARFRSLVQVTSDLIVVGDSPLLAAPNGTRPIVEDVIATGAFEPVYQPVANLRTREVVGFEALTRFDDGTPPDFRFKEAAKVGIGAQLEHATLNAAVDGASKLPPDLFLSINVSPALILERDAIVFAALEGSRPLVLELTEREPVDDYEALGRVLEGLGSVQLAVDDAGAGYASLRHILALHPAFIKLDITWVRGIDDDTARQALVAGINHFATLTTCRVIAEGVETEAEADALRRLGIEFGQGFLFGEPKPVDAYR